MTSVAVYKEKSKHRREKATLVIRTPLSERILCGFISLFYLLPMPVLGIVAVMSIQEGRFGEAVLIVPLLWYLGSVVWACSDAIFTRLIVSPAGIEYHINGYSGFAFWHDMECFGYRPIDDRREWGIVMNRQVEITRNRVRFLFRLYAARADSLDRFIPISLIQDIRFRQARRHKADRTHFKTTPLGKATLKYAPHLFEGVKAKGKRS